MPYWDTGSAGLAEAVRELSKAQYRLGLRVTIGALKPRRDLVSSNPSLSINFCNEISNFVII